MDLRPSSSCKTFRFCANPISNLSPCQAWFISAMTLGPRMAHAWAAAEMSALSMALIVKEGLLDSCNPYLASAFNIFLSHMFGKIRRYYILFLYIFLRCTIKKEKREEKRHSIPEPRYLITFSGIGNLPAI